MSWDSVIGQERVKDVLRMGIEQDRVSHAYLFFGPYGCGKRATAIAFAAALHCTDAPGLGCGTCANCSRISRMIHPDVRFFLPGYTDSEPDDIGERVALLAGNPYQTIDFIRRPTSKGGNRQVLYPISFVHGDIRSIVDYKSFEGHYKVVGIIGAESLSERTANAFLKILEEPSDRTVFILITERPDRLLPTVLSRCQHIRFDPLSASEVEQALVERAGLAEDQATPLARLADGSFSVALDLIDDEQARAFRESLLPFMRSVYVNDTFDVVDRVERVSAMSRDQVKLFLSLMLTWIRDLMLVRELGADAPIVNVDVRDNLERFCENLADARLDQMAELVEESFELISRNVRMQLVLMSLASGLRRSMMGKKALPLTTPLADQLVADVD